MPHNFYIFIFNFCLFVFVRIMRYIRCWPLEGALYLPSMVCSVIHNILGQRGAVMCSNMLCCDGVKTRKKKQPQPDFLSDQNRQFRVEELTSTSQKWLPPEFFPSLEG